MIPPFAEFERYDDSMDLVLSCSGGKDSVAIGIALKERGIPFRAVFADTGWEHPSTYTYLREVVPDLIGREVVEVRTELPLSDDLEVTARLFEVRLGFYSPMIRHILRWAMFSSRKAKWCTRHLKQYPLGRYLDTLDGDPIVVTGIRREESTGRSQSPAWEEMSVDITPIHGERLMQTQTHYRPGVMWTYDDVIGVFRHVGIAPSPLYLRGANRLGCWPCLNAGRDELRLLAQDDVRSSIVDDLESVVAELARERSEARGVGSPTFFQAKIKDKRTGKYPCWPIKRVLRWAKGKPRNPDQAELFWSPSDGCARWGLCPVEGPPPLVKS